MAKRKRIDPDRIPEILEKITAVIDREVDNLSQKATLSHEDIRDLLSLQMALTTTYKEHRAEIKAMKEDLKGKSKEDLLQIIKAESA